MPVPAVSANVAPASAAPSREATSSSLIEDVIQGAWKDTMVAGGTDEATLERDEHGRFRPRDEQPTTDEEPAAAAPAKPAKGTPKADPNAAPEDPDAEADAAEPATFEVADPATLATRFTLKDAAGGELAIPKGLMIEFPANGKTRAEPLDRVVKFAQMGVYNHEREQRIAQTESRAAEVETQYTELESRLTEREGQMERLLSDPAYLERALAEYGQLQTPEAREARLAREREEFHAEQQRTQLSAAGTQYFTTQVLPSVDMLVQATPHVTPDEITARLMPFVNRQKGHLGIVPPDRYDAISQHFLTEIVPWAQQLDEHRASETGRPSGRQQAAAQTAKQTETEATLEAERIRAAKARRLATRNLKPAGRTGTHASGTPASKPPTTVTEIMDDVINSTKAAMQMG